MMRLIRKYGKPKLMNLLAGKSTLKRFGFNEFSQDFEMVKQVLREQLWVEWIQERSYNRSIIQSAFLSKIYNVFATGNDAK